MTPSTLRSGMRAFPIRLLMTVLPAAIGLALLWGGYGWIAGLFLVAAGAGLAADVLIVNRARRR